VHFSGRAILVELTNPPSIESFTLLLPCFLHFIVSIKIMSNMIHTPPSPLQFCPFICPPSIIDGRKTRLTLVTTATNTTATYEQQHQAHQMKRNPMTVFTYALRASESERQYPPFEYSRKETTSRYQTKTRRRREWGTQIGTYTG
jgi:hypothetical protein